MPSEYESYGRTALEAMSAGIPVLCTPTGGLKESCSKAATYISRNDIESWCRNIRTMKGEKYKKQVAKGKDRVSTLKKTNKKELTKFLKLCAV